MNRISTFLKEVRIEMAKVSWPTKSQLIIYTLVVIGLSLFLMVYLGTVDFLLQKMISAILAR